MKTGILVTSFGTSHKDTRERSLEKIENIVKELYGEDCVEKAYTSGIVRKVIKRDTGEHFFNQEEGIEALKEKGYDKIITMTLHILDGNEYSKLNDKYGKVTAPLLTEEEDFERIVKDKEINDLKENQALIFMGHGSENKIADKTYEKLQKKYFENGKENIFIATVEGEIKIEDIIEKMKSKNYKKILLKPFMIVAGDHAKNDMASDEEEDSWKNILKNEGYEVETELKGLGEYSTVQNMFLEKLKKAL